MGNLSPRTRFIGAGITLLVLCAAGLVYAAWTESMLGFGFVPVTLAVHRVGSIEVHSEFVLDRALTTALALPASGPEIAANEWVDDSDLGLEGDKDVWAGVVRGADRVELGGWIAGLAAPKAGGRDVLLALPEGLCWFHSRNRLETRVTIALVVCPVASISMSKTASPAMPRAKSSSGYSGLT